MHCCRAVLFKKWQSLSLVGACRYRGQLSEMSSGTKKTVSDSSKQSHLATSQLTINRNICADRLARVTNRCDAQLQNGEVWGSTCAHGLNATFEGFSRLLFTNQLITNRACEQLSLGIQPMVAAKSCYPIRERVQKASTRKYIANTPFSKFHFVLVYHSR